MIDPNVGKEQIRLPLDDERSFLKQFVKELHDRYEHSMGTSICIFKRINQKNVTNYWLGTRTFYYDTDYDLMHKVSFEDAKWLCDTYRYVSPHMCHEDFYPPKKEIKYLYGQPVK